MQILLVKENEMWEVYLRNGPKEARLHTFATKEAAEAYMDYLSPVLDVRGGQITAEVKS